MSSLAKRLYHDEGRYVKAPFSVKRDRKTHGLVADFGNVSAEDRLSYWDQYTNALWFLEKENVIAIEDFDVSLRSFMSRVGFSKDETKTVIHSPTWRVSVSIRAIVFLLECGVNRPGTEAYAVGYLRSVLEVGDSEPMAYCTRVPKQRSRVIPFKRKNDGSESLIADLEELEDRIFVMTQNDREKSTVDLLVKRNPTPDGMKRVKAFFSPRLTEISEAINGSDPEVKEAYRHLTRKQLKIIEGWLSSIVSFSPAKPSKPIATRSRREKVVLPAKLVSKLRYMHSYDRLGLISTKPERIVGASVLWAYDTKYNYLLCYEAKDSAGLSVIGSKILNWSETASVRKTARNPEKFIPELLGKNRIGMRKAVDGLKTRSYGCSGQLNENILLLRTY